MERVYNTSRGGILQWIFFFVMLTVTSLPARWSLWTRELQLSVSDNLLRRNFWGNQLLFVRRPVVRRKEIINIYVDEITIKKLSCSFLTSAAAIGFGALSFGNAPASGFAEAAFAWAFFKALEKARKQIQEDIKIILQDNEKVFFNSLLQLSDLLFLGVLLLLWHLHQLQ